MTTALGQPLTPRQREIALMISEHGIASKEIGRRLDITESVVKSHLTRIFIKLGIRQRAQIHIAMRSELRWGRHQ